MSIRLVHGDCIEKMKDISGGSVDLLICDLPYGCLGAIDKNGDAQTWAGPNSKHPIAKNRGCAWDIKINLEKFWEQARRILRNHHCPVIHFCTTKFGAELIASNPSWFRYDLVWDKGRGVSFLSANKMPMRSHEMIYVFSKAGAFYNRVDVKGDFKNWVVTKKDTSHKSSTLVSSQYGSAKKISGEGGDGKRCVLSVIPEMGGNRKTNGHPTEKPVALYRWLIERYSPAEGTVLDPTAGSFNSCVAAQELGRHAIGIEKDDGFYKKAVDKLAPPQNTIEEAPPAEPTSTEE